MFDDILSAAALTGVVSILAAAALSALSTPPAPSGGSPLAAASPQHGSARARPVAERLPIPELPRVVVTGQRTRDGDRLAGGSLSSGRVLVTADDQR